MKAVVAVESAYEADAVSSKGALGLMQVIPETAARYGVTDDAKRTVAQKLKDPAINVSVGTRYLRDLLALFDNDVTLALAAYNAGEGGRPALRQSGAAVSRDAGVREARHPVPRSVHAAAAAARSRRGSPCRGARSCRARKRLFEVAAYDARCANTSPAMEPTVLPPSARSPRHPADRASRRPTGSTAPSSGLPARL